MPSFGSVSRLHLSTCHRSHRTFWQLIVAEYDCSILCGARLEEAQTAAFEAGLSHVQWPNSNHNIRPEGAKPGSWEWLNLPIQSRAVDVAPYPIDWNDKERFYHFAGYVKARAEAFNVKLRWGGDWDGDLDLRNQKFFDLVHWELL